MIAASITQSRLYMAAIVVLLVCTLSSIPAWSEKRVALVIGNQNYSSLAQLYNPAADAQSLATLLAANGFDVISCDGGQHIGCFDLKREGFLDALDTLKDKSSDADLALVFYSGHGMEGTRRQRTHADRYKPRLRVTQGPPRRVADRSAQERSRRAK